MRHRVKVRVYGHLGTNHLGDTFLSTGRHEPIQPVIGPTCSVSRTACINA